MRFTTTPRQLTELVELAGTLYQEAERCRDAGCGHAALILLGSAAEATLLATTCVFEPELRQAGLWAGKDDPSKWTLGKLAGIARRAGWLPTNRSKPPEYRQETSRILVTPRTTFSPLSMGRSVTQ